MKEEFIVIEVVNKYSQRWTGSYRVNPPPKYRDLLLALTEANGEKHVGRTLRTIVKDYFDKMPVDQRLRLIHKSKNHY